MSFGRLLNTLTLSLAGLLFVPAGLVLASWNALPGDTLYPTKRNLEKVALAILSPSYQAKTDLSTQLIARRLEEADATIVKKSSSQGLEELKAQLTTAQIQVQQAPTEQAKKAASKKLVATLQKTQTKLEVQKQVLIAAAPPQAITQSPTSPPPSASPLLTPEPQQQIVNNITIVQNQINNIIISENQPSSSEPNQDRGNSEDHRQNDQPKDNQLDNHDSGKPGKN